MKGIEGIMFKLYKYKPVKVSDDEEKKIVDIAAKNPREFYGLPFSTWSLRILAGYSLKG